ncbi:MAG TPA: hypothetical protein VK513_13120 [Terriglobales bacterium]|nr:hypothetical protein [Terriglobales bacterium]
MFTRPRLALRNLTFVLLAIAVSKPASAQLVLYDNFNSKHIDPSKWIGLQFYDPDVREVVRDLAGEDRNRRLHLSQVAYSATTDNNGSLQQEGTIPRSSR